MVTAKTQHSLANAQAYFAEHLAVGDYYHQGQRVAGEWFGIGAASLKLSGHVTERAFLALYENLVHLHFRRHHHPSHTIRHGQQIT